MTLRFCPVCRSEVDDVGGFCLLGHRLSHTAPSAPLAELRADVDRAFEEAQARVDEVLAPVAVGGGSLAPAPPRPPAATSIATKSAPVPPIGEAVPPPAPPLSAPAAYSALSSDHVVQGDPIAAFAPAPRMDWGPERSFLRRRPRRSSVDLD